MFLDAVVVKVRDHHAVANKPAYLAIGIDTDGEKHVLGIWVSRPSPDPVVGEGSKFWRHALADLKNRGVADILIACCDDLSGFEDAIGAVFPDTTAQTCVVHLIRNSLRLVPPRTSRGGRGPQARLASANGRYPAPNVEAAWNALAAFADTEAGRRSPRPSRSGNGPGSASSRFWPSPRPCAACSTPPTASSR
ncbi:transposase [Halostreptopolyspora alba]|uniref:Mutator family transposase n=1 Tax=Halostreptopolyspora alba TaxID=2487137 RepID=A0A3N0E2P9_9ACTN|nr:hypothetical protein EFW17_20435 [Nocardiopsaceae bacterium YIM 96095]